GPATNLAIAGVVSVIDTATNAVVATIRLPVGAHSLRGICVSPDGGHVFVTHVLSRFYAPTTQVTRGWMNTAGLSVIEVATTRLVNTVLLDDLDLGAANPWGVACTADGQYLCVAHAGTHEISVIDRSALLTRLQSGDAPWAGRNLPPARAWVSAITAMPRSAFSNGKAALAAIRMRGRIRSTGT
ncbi:MAG: hypothetical protein NT154_32500, partial [Verrucomicrobia bacterium]|nr:hypothetical protein [Verrucomicrobiota bacterium]